MGAATEELTLRADAEVVVRWKSVVLGALALPVLVPLELTSLRAPMHAASSGVLVPPRGHDGLLESQIDGYVVVDSPPILGAVLNQASKQARHGDYSGWCAAVRPMEPQATQRPPTGSIARESVAAADV